MSSSGLQAQSYPRQSSLWASVWKLLRLRLLIWWNTFRRAKTRRKVGTAILALFIIGLVVGLFFVSHWLLGLLNSPELAKYIDPPTFVILLPTLVLTAAFILTILTNFGILLQALYLSRDMDFLVSSPLPMRAVFIAKLLEAILPNFALFCAFTLPVLFGLGAAQGFKFLYYPFLVITLIFLALAAGGLAGLLVMAVVRVVPARRVAEVLGVVGATFSILCGQSGNVLRMAGLTQSDYSGSLLLLARLNTPWSPITWASSGLLALGRGEWLVGSGLTLLTLLLAGGLFTGTLILAEQLYYTGWTSMQGVNRKKKPLKAISPQALPVAPPEAKTTLNRTFPIAAPLVGLIVKDFLVLRRDPRNLSQLITPLILGVVFIFTTRIGSKSFAGLPARFNPANFEMYILIGMAVFVGWMLLTNLAPLAFSREGRNYWLVKSAPLRPLHLITAKYLVSCLPAMLLSMVYLTLGFAIHNFNWTLFPFSIGVVALSIAGATGIALAFGIAGANLEWDSPQRQRLSGTTGCLMMIAVVVFFGLDLGLFLVPPALWLFITGGTSPLPYLLGLILGGAAAGAAIIIPLSLVLPRLSSIGEK
jgi:ABC-2 type transport system permease protein